MHRSLLLGACRLIYLRRRGENTSSFEVESVLMSHGALADVAVHAAPSQLSEDYLRVTAVLQANPRLSAAELSDWCVTQWPYFALPRRLGCRGGWQRVRASIAGAHI